MKHDAVTINNYRTALKKKTNTHKKEKIPSVSDIEAGLEVSSGTVIETNTKNGRCAVKNASRQMEMEGVREIAG